MLSMIRQLPKFRKAIRNEHDQVERLVQMHRIDIVISDNRYGCWSKRVRSVIITHQVHPLMPSGFGWLSPIVHNYSDRCLEKFEQVWIPDRPGSGMTDSFNPRPTPNQRYIGWLSRFSSNKVSIPKYEILALVSGPEPQRTIFEKLMTDQLKASGKKSLLVAGVTEKTFHRFEDNLEIVNHLTLQSLQEAMLSAEIVISRSGYSTLMDLMVLGRNAIFVPTPGQPEQLFFAEYYKLKKIAFSCDQESFSLSKALEASHEYVGFSSFTIEGDYLTNAISTLLS